MAKFGYKRLIAVAAAFAVMCAALLAPSLAAAKTGTLHAVSTGNHASDVMAHCQHSMKSKPKCPNSGCLETLACLAKCTQSLALIDALDEEFQSNWGTITVRELTALMCSRSIPPLLRPPST